MSIVRVLSCDPGTKNSAMFVADLVIKNGSVKSIKVVASFMMTVTRQSHTAESRRNFCKYVKSLKKKYKPQIFICERFQPRGGMLKNSILEQVNWMISDMCTIFNVDERLVTAASWKNVYTKRGKIDLKMLYKEYKTIGPHRLDCVLMMLNQFKFKHCKTEQFLRRLYPQLLNCKEG